MSDDERKARQAESQMIAEALQAAGLDVSNITDLVYTRDRYPQAIPVLLDLLPRVKDPLLRNGVARALAVREARPIATRPLIREFIAAPVTSEAEKHTKWAIGMALGVTADDSVFTEVLALLGDKRHGWPRSGIVRGLANMKLNRERAIAALIELLTDGDAGVQNQSFITLGRLRVKEARHLIEPFLRSKDSWVRQQAKRALAKIDKAPAPSRKLDS